MASCRDCVHEKICRYNDGVNQYCKGNGGFDCPYFKDRSKFIELPCKVGDTVYRVGEFVEGVKELTIDHFRIFKYTVSAFSDPWDGEICEIHQIGKIVNEPYDWNGYFLSREEAEKALKEREING